MVMTRTPSFGILNIKLDELALPVHINIDSCIVTLLRELNNDKNVLTTYSTSSSSCAHAPEPVPLL